MENNKILQSKELEERVKELGISLDRLYSEAGINEPELQRRVLEAERSLRESRLWIIVFISKSIGSKSMGDPMVVSWVFNQQ